MWIFLRDDFWQHLDALGSVRQPPQKMEEPTSEVGSSFPRHRCHVTLAISPAALDLFEASVGFGGGPDAPKRTRPHANGFSKEARSEERASFSTPLSEMEGAETVGFLVPILGEKRQWPERFSQLADRETSTGNRQNLRHLP